jgi:hypothetical protein
MPMPKYSDLRKLKPPCVDIPKHTIHGASDLSSDEGLLLNVYSLPSKLPTSGSMRFQILEAFRQHLSTMGCDFYKFVLMDCQSSQ